MDFTQLIGSHYTSFSSKADCQSTKNLMLERIESGAGRNPFVLYRSPGLKVWPAATDKSKNVCRGFLELNDRVWAVQSDRIYQIDSTGAIIYTSPPIANDGLPVSMDASLNTLHVRLN